MSRHHGTDVAPFLSLPLLSLQLPAPNRPVSLVHLDYCLDAARRVIHSDRLWGVQIASSGRPTTTSLSHRADDPLTTRSKCKWES